MIVKPAIGWLNSDGELLLINDVTVVYNAMTDNVLIYKDPDPPLADVKLALDNYSTAVYLPNPSQVDTINKNNLRLVLTNTVRSLSYYVAKACNGSMANLILSGFPPQKGKGQPVGTPATPQGLTVSHGSQLSQLVVKVNPVFGAVYYNYRLLANTPGAVPVIKQDTAATHTFSDLIGGVNYTVDVSASGTGGAMSDWSSPASLIAD
jgi:hypothetical protein